MSAPLNRRIVASSRFAGTHSRSRTGFTLIELLAVITVIAILAGLLTPVIIRSLQTAQEVTITTEVNQLQVAIDKFHTEFGFYPPTIGSNANFEISSAADMLRYLNRIAPNHQENNLAAAFPSSSNTRLVDWWTEVGANLDERSSLVFWLNGLFKNKQFPLTGSAAATMPLVAYNDDLYSDASTAGLNLERDLRFEFGKILPDPDGNGDPVAVALQPAGDDAQDLAYRYLDYKSYAFGAYNDGTDFLNPNTFQLVGFGIDGKTSGTPNVFAAGPADDDNICNFAGGRLDKYVNENQ